MLNTDYEPGKSKWFAKGNLEDVPHVSDLNRHGGVTQGLSLSLPCAYPQVLYSFSS